MSLRVGIKLGQGLEVDELVEFWKLADEMGFDSLWNNDHLMAVGSDEGAPAFEAWTMLAAMARETARVRIGCMVSGNTYRHPGMLAKLAVTVDHLSRGRLEFGIGAGWNEREHEMFGLELPAVGRRMDRWEESLRVIRSLWSEERTTLPGEHYQVRDAVAEPKPVQRPHPPVWVGGSGPQRTLRIAAMYADAWNCTGESPERFGELSAILDQHCSDVGRDPDAVRRTVQLRTDRLPGGEPVERVAERYAAVGASELIAVLPIAEWREALDRLAGVLDRLQSIR